MLGGGFIQSAGAALEALPGVTVRKVSDRTFLIHLGGKVEVTPKVIRLRKILLTENLRKRGFRASRQMT